MKNTELYSSKYALTAGVEKKVLDRELDDGFVKIEGSYCVFKTGRDIHPTRAAAVEAAEAMRLKKISSLKKQIAKLEKLTFAA